MKTPNTVLFLLCFANVFAQLNIDESHSLAGINNIKGNFEWSNITVESYPGNELKITGEVFINLGENNDAYQLKVDRVDDVLQIRSDIKDVKSLPKYLTIYKGGEEIFIRIKDRKEIDWREIKRIHGIDAGEKCSMGTLIDIKLTLLVPEGPQLELETKYGSIEMIECANSMNLKSTYGDLIAALPDLTQAESSFKSTYGFVDLSVPDNTGVDLSAHTNHGEIYSNLDWGIDTRQSVNEIYNSRIVGPVNRGGKKIDVEALYDNVYLRKKT
ncbi:MAG: DUF4097 family beta strand repeat protein [Saprospiraceae bacterium]|nr:DUF4097 family beta strand repeat protein [Saprospiraceae bacterium]